MPVRATLQTALLVMVAGILVPQQIFARKHEAEPPFKYAGGTVNLPEGCTGKLEVEAETLVFACPEGSVTIPYTSIRLMQYRHDVSRKIRKMKLRWYVKPQIVSPVFGGSQNRFFTVLFKGEHKGRTEALVLEVPPDAMRPYLAELDLKVGQRVEVEGYEHYD
jgi:hypothetical protein